MRNIPFAFLDEATIDRITKADQERINGFARMAETQRSMRGLPVWPATGGTIKRVLKRLVALLEQLTEMSGPNSIANLERALKAQNGSAAQR